MWFDGFCFDNCTGNSVTVEKVRVHLGRAADPTVCTVAPVVGSQSVSTVDTHRWLLLPDAFHAACLRQRLARAALQWACYLHLRKSPGHIRRFHLGVLPPRGRKVNFIVKAGWREKLEVLGLCG